MWCQKRKDLCQKKQQMTKKIFSKESHRSLIYSNGQKTV